MTCWGTQANWEHNFQQKKKQLQIYSPFWVSLTVLKRLLGARLVSVLPSLGIRQKEGNPSMSGLFWYEQSARKHDFGPGVSKHPDIGISCSRSQCDWFDQTAALDLFSPRLFRRGHFQIAFQVEHINWTCNFQAVDKRGQVPLPTQIT